MIRKYLGWALVVVPAGGIVLGLVVTSFGLLGAGDHVAAEASTAFEVGAMVAIVALVPMGLGAMLVRSAGGASRELRRTSGWVLVVVPVVHVALLLSSGAMYYADPPWAIDEGEFGRFLLRVGLYALVAAIPVGSGVTLLRNSRRTRQGSPV